MKEYFLQNPNYTLLLFNFNKVYLKDSYMLAIKVNFLV